MSSAETAQQIKSLLKGIHEERADAARLDELRRLFGQLVKSGDLTFSDREKETATKKISVSKKASHKWQAFLEKQHQKMVSQLMVRIVQNKKTAVRTMWGVIAASPKQYVNNALTTVHPDLVYQWLKAMMGMEEDIDKSLRHMIEQEFLHPYRDVQYYALVSIARLATDGYNSLDENEAERLLQLLMMVPISTGQKDFDASNYLFPPPEGNVDVSGQSGSDDSDSDVGSNDDNDSSDEDDESDQEEEEEENESSKKRKRYQPSSKGKRTFAFQQVKQHHKALSNAWLAVLKLQLPINALNHALRFLPTNILPKVPQPLRFSDFFVRAYSPGNGGVTSLLALDGLFYLMTEHGLEHPRFYESLYTLVQPQALGAKHRGRFLELLTKCLCRNEMLPAHIVASFVKRLLRAALNAPPPGALFVLAISANLLRQHAECACLIHRKGDEDDTNAMTDVFDAHTNDPTQTRALESSLWELSALSQHYYPAVATLAKSIGTEDDKTPLLDTDDFLRHTYKSLFDQERKRGEASHKKKRQKKVATPLTFVEPKSLFEDDILGDILSIKGNR